jgi:hypothetical protein
MGLFLGAIFAHVMEIRHESNDTNGLNIETVE